MVVINIGSVCFGLVVGFITYRTLVHSNDKASISDLAAVLAAIGGGAVTALFPEGSEAFGYYSIGLAVGVAVYLVVALRMRKDPLQILSTEPVPAPGARDPETPDPVRPQ
jgi:peptidoglycan/LPS O-acetylase OafA/YrhL